MTTIVAFTPNNTNSPPFSTVFTLDGTSYNAAVTWNIAGQRWYLTLTNQAGTVIWNGALIGSPLDYDILLAPGVFKTSTLLYREDSGNFEVTP
jgi:hypothetical protein